MKVPFMRVAGALPFLVGVALAAAGCGDMRTSTRSEDYRAITLTALAQLGIPASDISDISLIADRAPYAGITGYHIWARRISCRGWVVFRYDSPGIADPYATGDCKLP